MARAALAAVSLALLGAAGAGESACPSGDEEASALLQSATARASKVSEHGRSAANGTSPCGNLGYACQSCQVCVGGYKSYACTGSCANNEACGPGDSKGSCPTCADRVKTLCDNLMGVQDAMTSVGGSYSDCKCMKTQPDPGCPCGNSGTFCTGTEVCVGGYKSYACAGSCANNPACGPGDSPGSCPTCADRVKTLCDNLMGVEDAMASVGQNYGYQSPGCGCMASPSPTPGPSPTPATCATVGETCFDSVDGKPPLLCCGDAECAQIPGGKVCQYPDTCAAPGEKCYGSVDGKPPLNCCDGRECQQIPGGKVCAQ